MNLHDFHVEAKMFDHPSWLHGVNHTCRVMSLVWALGTDMGLERERNLAFCAAYIHDTAREGDGVCHIHGPQSAEMKLPLYIPFFLEQGIAEPDIAVIRTAIANHSIPMELEKSDPHYLVTSLLKDADALDRFRLGPFNLDKKFLRLAESQDFISCGKKLFLKTAASADHTFMQVLGILEKITGKAYPRQ
jgi:hypothetical protein